jgi:sterol desaturase/sphingolipid hydroxylase (fatty acid hydroxylase superfamily)
MSAMTISSARVNPIYVSVAIPIFFALIFVERVASKRRTDPRYRFADSITNLSCGIGQQVTGVFVEIAVVGAYVLVWEHARVLDVPLDAWWAWPVVMVAIDLLYYWFHRASHRVNFLWAAHVVHHQSEEYNLSVALRQSALQSLGSAPFYLVLALLGFPAAMFVTAKTINTLYQFWIHTREVGRLGPMEWIMNTPSHHRVHHGIDPKYIDKNHAGMFIVWDRMFGTFIDEAEEPTYGTVKPLRSWNPVWANFAEWAAIARLSADARRLGDKLYAWIAPPEWRPRDLGGPVTIPATSRAAQVRYDAKVPARVKAYVNAHFVLVAGGVVVLLLARDAIGPWGSAAIVAMVLLTTAVWGGLFERRRWARPLEVARVLALPALAGWLAAGTPWLAWAVGGAAAVTVLSAAALLRAPVTVPA